MEHQKRHEVCSASMKEERPASLTSTAPGVKQIPSAVGMLADSSKTTGFAWSIASPPQTAGRLIMNPPTVPVLSGMLAIRKPLLPPPCCPAAVCQADSTTASPSTADPASPSLPRRTELGAAPAE
mmetsp:Transcript_24514/g.53555  ORF Transcript_24514/g.53555 Transcript_24514/m.53555 type:complete len:125 (-) Transcript_24514:974-1348(-)